MTQRCFAAVLPSPPATRTDIMETIHAALLEAGSRIAPLASLDEIAGFFQAAAAIGPTAPARATAVTQRLGGSLVDAARFHACEHPSNIAFHAERGEASFGAPPLPGYASRSHTRHLCRV